MKNNDLFYLLIGAGLVYLYMNKKGTTPTPTPISNKVPIYMKKPIQMAPSRTRIPTQNINIR
jgi:hypothetical protein